MVNVTRLREALQRCLWRQGFVHPEHLTHTREANGDHRFSVVIPQGMCEYEPAKVPGPSSLGAVADAGDNQRGAVEP
jgi:hypothetical protein